MSFREFNLDEAAQYLHIAPAELETLAKRGEIPCERRGGRRVFRRKDIDAWASQRILGLPDRGLDAYHAKSTHGTREFVPSAAILDTLIQPPRIAPALAAKTKSSVLRELVLLAERTGLVADPRDLLESLEAREALCSTGLPGGMAIPHPRHHEAYMFEDSFIIVGRTVQEIHFGAPDGRSTDLFFLLCCQDDRLHLHLLARLCLVAMKTDLLPRLREAADADAMHQCLLACEAEALQP